MNLKTNTMTKTMSEVLTISCVIYNTTSQAISSSTSHFWNYILDSRFHSMADNRIYAFDLLRRRPNNTYTGHISVISFYSATTIHQDNIAHLQFSRSCCRMRKCTVFTKLDSCKGRNSSLTTYFFVYYMLYFKFSHTK